MQIRREVLNIERSFRPRGRRVQGDSVAVWISVIPIWISRNPREREWNGNTPSCKAYCVYFSCRLVGIFAQRAQERIKSTFDIKVVWRWI